MFNIFFSRYLFVLFIVYHIFCYMKRVLFKCIAIFRNIYFHVILIDTFYCIQYLFFWLFILYILFFLLILFVIYAFLFRCYWNFLIFKKKSELLQAFEIKFINTIFFFSELFLLKYFIQSSNYIWLILLTRKNEIDVKYIEILMRNCR